MDLATADIGSRAFRIDGAQAGDRAGISVDGAGDINFDGLADIVVGADQDNNDLPGAAFVVFGKTNADNVNLAQLGNGGYRINGVKNSDHTGYSVAGAGDIDRDGRPDVFVGAYSADPNDRLDAGAAYVVYGKDGNEPVNLAGFGLPGGDENGFRLDGEASGDRAGRSVAGTGDFDGDDQADVLLGADRASNADGERSGVAYVYLPEPPPVISIDDVQTTEGNSGASNVTFTVSLSRASGEEVTVDYATNNGTATAGSDYVAKTGKVTFAPGETSKTIEIEVNGDTADEPDETFTVELSNAKNATISDGSGTGTITDDDEPPNRRPNARDDSYNIKQGQSLKVNTRQNGVLRNDSDPDGDRLRVTGVPDEPNNGTLRIDADGTFTYTPKKNFRGKDSFEYEIRDGKGGTDRAKVTINVSKSKRKG